MIARPIHRVLVFNPNTSQSITDTFPPILSRSKLPHMQLTYWTCPSGPSIIKTHEDLLISAAHCLPLLLPLINSYDGFLCACYADHPIVDLLRTYTHKPVVGIFDASVYAAKGLVGSKKKFGIITTGKAFETLLAEGVLRVLKNDCTATIGQEKELFGAVTASGIGATDMLPKTHDKSKEKIKAATRQLVSLGEVDTICIGGVVLAGTENWIRQACEEELGVDAGRQVKIIEQLTVGAIMLDAMLRNEVCVDFTLALR